MKKSEPKFRKAAENQFRVIKIADVQRKRIREARDAAKLTNQRMIEEALNRQLPEIIQELTTLGIQSRLENPQATRLPFDPAALAELKAASAELGVPQVVLLRMALGREAERILSAKKPRARRASKKGGAK